MVAGLGCQAYMKIEMITSAAPIPKVLFGSKPKSGTDAMHEREWRPPSRDS